jgi:hypothetical protein
MFKAPMKPKWSSAPPAKLMEAINITPETKQSMERALGIDVKDGRSLLPSSVPIFISA